MKTKEKQNNLKECCIGSVCLYLVMEAHSVVAIAAHPANIFWNTSGNVCRNAFIFNGMDNNNP